MLYGKGQPLPQHVRVDRMYLCEDGLWFTSLWMEIQRTGMDAGTVERSVEF